MTRLMKEALDAVATLPEPDQEKIGRELLLHVEKLRSLRTDLDKGIRSLKAGRGKTVDIEDVIRRARIRKG
jgi:hypothetical protein